MGNDLSSVISGAGDVVGFSGLGAAIGSIIPGVGTLIGGLLGLAIGSAKEAVTVSRFVDAQRAGNGPALSGSYLASQIGFGVFGAVTGSLSAVTGGGGEAASILGGTVAKSAIRQTGIIAARKGIQAVSNRAATRVAGTVFSKPIDAIRNAVNQNPNASPGQISAIVGSKVPSMIVEGGLNGLINKYTASRNMGFTDRTMSYANNFTSSASNNYRGPMNVALHGFKTVVAASNHLQNTGQSPQAPPSLTTAPPPSS